MRNVYDIARELVDSLKETDQYKNMEAAKKAVQGNQGVIDMINDFNQKNTEAQMSAMANGGKIDDEMMQKVQSLYAIMIQDPTASQYLAAQLAYSQVLSELYKIIGDGAGIAQ